jgi:uncharacterized membrane protein YqjE
MPRDKLKEQPMLESLHRLSRDGRSWIAAEAAFAQAEVASDGKRLVQMLLLGALVFGCVFAAVILACVFFVTVLAPYVGGLTAAAGLLSLLLAMAAALAGWRLWYLASQQFGISSVLKRWWNFAALGPGKKQ